MKKNVAEYFGLPIDLINLKNSNDEILLKDQLVVQELFPMLSSKMVGVDPKIWVCFQSNMTTKDLILGDPRIAAALKKEREDKEKQLQKQKEKEKKEWVLMEKEEMMAAEREKMK